MEFCHSFGKSVSLAAIETSEENDGIKKWLNEHGKSMFVQWSVLIAFHALAIKRHYGQ